MNFKGLTLPENGKKCEMDGFPRSRHIYMLPAERTRVHACIIIIICLPRPKDRACKELKYNNNYNYCRNKIIIIKKIIIIYV